MRKIFELFGTVTVKGAESAAKGLQKLNSQGRTTQKALGKLGAQMTNLGKTFTATVTGPIAGLTAGMVALTKTTGDYADSLLDLQQITGLSLKNLQEFENVAREAGVDFRGLTNTMSQLSGKIPEIARGTGEGAKALKDLGVSVFDAAGNVRDMNELFPELIRKLGKVQNITERNSKAQKIFGEDLKNIAPVIGMTTEQLEAARMEAHELGAVMSDEAINAANEMRVEYAKLTASLQGAWRSLAVELIPVMRDTLVPMVRDSVLPVIQWLVAKVGDLADMFNSLTPPVKKSTVGVTGFAAAVGPALLAAGGLLKVTKSLIPVLGTLRAGVLSLSKALLTNPYGIAIAGLATLTVGAVKATKALEELRAERMIAKAQEDPNFVDDDAIQRRVDAENEGNKRQAESARGRISREAEDRRKAFEAERKVFRAELEEKSKARKKESADAVAARKRAADDAKRAADERARLAESAAKRREEIGLSDVAMLERQMDAELSAIGDNQAARLDIVEYYSSEIRRVEAEDAKESEDIAAELARDRAEIEEDYARRVLAQNDQRIEILRREKADAIKLAQEKGADIAQIEAYYDKQMADQKKSRGEQDRAEMQKNVDSYIGYISQAYGAVMSISAEASRARMQDISNWKKAELDAIEASTMSEEEKKTAIQKLNDEAEEKQRAAARRNAAAEKVEALFAIALNTATSISKVLYNPFLVGLVTTLGAAQAAAVAARPLPLAKGGLVPQQSGGILAQVGEGAEDEVVFPLKTGVAQMVDLLSDKVRRARFGTAEALGAPEPGMAGGGGSGLTINAGVIVGDKTGFKALERRLRDVRILDDQRRGSDG